MEVRIIIGIDYLGSAGAVEHYGFNVPGEFPTIVPSAANQGINPGF